MTWLVITLGYWIVNLLDLISWLIDLSFQALYVKDGTYYEAVIEEINKDQVTVKFIGYQVILSIDCFLLIGLIDWYYVILIYWFLVVVLITWYLVFFVDWFISCNFTDWLIFVMIDWYLVTWLIDWLIDWFVNFILWLKKFLIVSFTKGKINCYFSYFC